MAATTRADAVYTRLRADILSGELAPGQRLKFPELCGRYETSVGAAREALARLASGGLVRAQAFQGYVVTPLSVPELVELTTARVEVESLVLRMSVRNGDTPWEADAVAAHHLLERAPWLDEDSPTRSTEHWAQAHARFHDALLAGCGNHRLRTMAGSLRDEAELYRQRSIAPGQRADRDIVGEHRAILAAAVARDADRAARLLREHITLTTRLIMETDGTAAH
jgi:DNA-binding GntR family transcriptional regulator